ncbi:hypothetical protein AAG570_003464 [Ranatra chinensis]|uniref:Trichohyalin-plectin-homology domain-containing protein n=1 Tax=Ranatra chinensis TaxID=642074 RepID=A0ABD0Y3T1_9HEMI
MAFKRRNIQKDSEERSLREKKKQREEELKALESFKKDLDQFKADERKETERRKKLLRQNMAENINLNKLKVKQRKEEDEEERAALHIISEAKKTISMIKRKKELEFQAAKINWRSMMTSLVSPQLPTTDYIEEEKKIEKVQKEKEEQYKYSLMKRKEYEQKLIEERKKQHEEFLKSEEKKKVEKSEVNKKAVKQRSVVQELDKQFTDKIKYEKRKTLEDYREAWQQQINENKSTNEYEKQIENSILMKEIKKSDEGKQQFLHYAENLLKECEEKERPVHPLKKYLNEYGLLYSAEEWKAVTEKLGEKKRNQTEVTERREDLMARKALSDGMRKTWTDTMEYREKRRKERLAKEAKAADDAREKMRKELEVETATTRRELMEKFDEKLFLNADGPKSLHSAYRCAEAVRQRSIQLQFAKHVKDVEADHQRAYDESKIQDAEKFKKEEEEKQKIKYEKEKKCKEEMWKTYKDNEERKAREAEEKKKRDHEDLENMKKEIEQIKANEKAETERKQRIARENVAENKKMFEHNMKIRREEELEEATATQYVLEMKRKIAAVRKQKEIEAQAERLARRDRNIAVAMVETADKEKEEEERRKRAQEEKEQKYQKEELSKKEHQKRLADEIKKQQEEYVENESKKKREEHEKRKWEIMQLHKKIEINEEFEEEAKRNKYTKTADFKDIWSKQMEENRAKIETERMIERNMAANVAKSVEEFDARFFTYANKLIEESNARGRPTLPLEKLVQDYKFTTGKLKAPRPVGKEGWEEDSEEENTNVPSQIFNEMDNAEVEGGGKPTKTFEYAPDGIRANGLQK